MQKILLIYSNQRHPDVREFATYNEAIAYAMKTGIYRFYLWKVWM